MAFLKRDIDGALIPPVETSMQRREPPRQKYRILCLEPHFRIAADIRPTCAYDADHFDARHSYLPAGFGTAMVFSNPCLPDHDPLAIYYLGNVLEAHAAVAKIAATLSLWGKIGQYINPASYFGHYVETPGFGYTPIPDMEKALYSEDTHHAVLSDTYPDRKLVTSTPKARLIFD